MTQPTVNRGEAMGVHGTGGFGRTAIGCLVYLAVFGVLAAWLDQFTAPHVTADARPWLGVVASFFLTAALAAVWGLVSAPGDSRAAVLKRAAEGSLPDHDGPAVASGTVRASGVPLVAPLSGVPCVAYLYRMYYETTTVGNGQTGATRVRTEVPVYWGHACRAFVLDTRRQAVRVMAVPNLQHEATRCVGADDVARANRHIAATRFEEASGLLGAVGTAFSVVSTMFTDEDGEVRQDWKRSGATRDAGTLLLEETILPVGAQASVAGTWSVDRRAIVAASSGSAAVGVTATVGSMEGVLEGSSQVPASTWSVLLTALVCAAIGAAVLWGGMIAFAPGR